MATRLTSKTVAQSARSKIPVRSPLQRPQQGLSQSSQASSVFGYRSQIDAVAFRGKSLQD